MEQEAEKQKATPQVINESRHYIEYLSCRTKFDNCCIHGLYSHLRDHTALPQSGRDHDISYLALAEMNNLISASSTSTAISRSPCCIFSSSIPGETKDSTTNPPKPPPDHTTFAYNSGRGDSKPPDRRCFNVTILVSFVDWRGWQLTSLHRMIYTTITIMVVPIPHCKLYTLNWYLES